MRITKTFCDICKKECHQLRFGAVAGCVAKMDETGQMKNMQFEGHYCEDDVGKIIEFIEKLNETSNRRTEQPGESNSGGK